MPISGEISYSALISAEPPPSAWSLSALSPMTRIRFIFSGHSGRRPPSFLRRTMDSSEAFLMAARCFSVLQEPLFLPLRGMAEAYLPPSDSSHTASIIFRRNISFSTCLTLLSTHSSLMRPSCTSFSSGSASQY